MSLAPHRALVRTRSGQSPNQGHSPSPTSLLRRGGAVASHPAAKPRRTVTWLPMVRFQCQHQLTRPEDAPTTDYRAVTQEYFKSMGIPLEGRDFTDREMQEAPDVVIINKTMEEILAASLSQLRLSMSLLVVFANSGVCWYLRGDGLHRYSTHK